MKIAGIVAVAIAAMATFAWAASAASNGSSSTAEVAALKQQVAKLQRDVAKLQKDGKALKKETDALVLVVGGCLAYDNRGVTMYGTDTEGYVYAKGQDTPFLTTALDFAPDGEQPHGYFLAINPQCAGLLHPAPYRSLAGLAGALEAKGVRKGASRLHAAPASRSRR
jgi:beta-lactamase class A